MNSKSNLTNKTNINLLRIYHLVCLILASSQKLNEKQGYTFTRAVDNLSIDSYSSMIIDIIVWLIIILLSHLDEFCIKNSYMPFQILNKKNRRI